MKSSIQPVRLVGVTHHKLGFTSMHELRDHSGGLNLVHDPVPVADGFDCHVRTLGTALQEPSDHSRAVINPGFTVGTAILRFDTGQRVLLVGVKCDELHGCASYAASAAILSRSLSLL